MKLKLLLMASMLLWISCDRPLWYLEVTKDTLHEKMSLYPNDETISWWYTGDDGSFRYFVMEKEASWPDDGYKVPEASLDFIRDKDFELEHGAGRDAWKRVSRNDFRVKGSLLEQTIAIPNNVRGKLKGLTQDDGSESEDEEDPFEDDEDLDDEDLDDEDLDDEDLDDEDLDDEDLDDENG